VFELFHAHGAALNEREAAHAAVFLELLASWSRSMNLVGKKNWPEILTDLMLDSWFLAQFLETLDLPETCLSFDLGAGAGLPGIPLRLFWGRGSYVMVELRAKRATFLRYALAKLASGLQGPSTVFEGRAEDILSKEAPDLALSRAFKPWDQVLALVAPWLKPDGRVVFMASDPPPAPPEGWRLLASEPYPAPAAKAKTRYFWAFAPVIDSSSESLKINLVATASAASPNSMSFSKKSKIS
jgi:16S rRNA (guanine527-N7)-methyltransferase